MVIQVRGKTEGEAHEEKLDTLSESKEASVSGAR